MELNQAHQELDGNLPTELRGTADMFGLKRSSEGAGTSASSVSDPLTEEPPMSGTANTVQPPLTNDQVVTAARAEVARIFEAKDSQVQVAASIEKYMTAANVAQANATQLQAQVTDLTAKLAIASAVDPRGTNKTQENPEVAGANKDSKDWHGIAPAAYAELKKQVDDLTAALAAEKKKSDMAAKMKDMDNKKNDRKGKMDSSKVKSKSFKDRAMASNEDGSFKMSDTDFDQAIAEFTENAATEQAAAGDTGGMPIPAPVDKTGPAAEQKGSAFNDTKGGKEIPAPKDGTGPAAQQRTAKLAHASEEAPKEGETKEVEKPATQAAASTNSAVPANPDLGSADIMAQATAAILAQNGPPASKSGKTNYAKAFGI